MWPDSPCCTGAAPRSRRVAQHGVRVRRRHQRPRVAAEDEQHQADAARTVARPRIRRSHQKTEDRSRRKRAAWRRGSAFTPAAAGAVPATRSFLIDLSRRSRTIVAPSPPSRGRAEANAMTPQRSAAALASHSQTAGRKTGPPASDPWPRPWITSKAAGATRDAAARGNVPARAAPRRGPRPCRSSRASTACAPPRSSRNSLSGDVARAARDARRPSARRRTPPRGVAAAAVCGVAGDRGLRRRHPRVPQPERTRAPHRLGERLVVIVHAIVVVAAIIGRRHRAI